MVTGVWVGFSYIFLFSLLRSFETGRAVEVLRVIGAGVLMSTECYLKFTDVGIQLADDLI